MITAYGANSSSFIGAFELIFELELDVRRNSSVKFTPLASDSKTSIGLPLHPACRESPRSLSSRSGVTRTSSLHSGKHCTCRVTDIGRTICSGVACGGVAFGS